MKHVAWVVLVLALTGVISPATVRAQPPVAPPSDPAIGFFNNAVLHDIYLTINTKDWQTLQDAYLENTYYPADLRWGTEIVRNTGIRSRGTGSRSGTKPGLRIDFDRYTSNQKFLGLKSIILRNSTQDATNMHEQISMLFFRKLGLIAPRETFARLFINNGYAGLYSVVESIDKVFLAANFGSDAGYLYKYDYAVTDAPYYFTYRTANAADYVPKPFKPETHETDAHPQIIERFAWTLNNASDATFRSAIAEFMDVYELIRHVASEIFLADNDGFLGNWGMNNFYLYRLAENHVFRFVDWDKSEAFKDTPDYWIWHSHLDVPDPIRNRLWTRVMSYPDLKAYFLDYLLQCANAAMEIPADSQPGDTRGWMERELDREFALIDAAVQADPTKPFSNEQFAAAVGFLRQFIQQRAGFVQNQVAQSP